MILICECYVDDKMKQQQVLMEFYCKEKINLVVGCWLVLIQILVFFVFYKVFFVIIEMCYVLFFGWICDFVVLDLILIFNLFGLLFYNLGVVLVIGYFLMFGVWLIFMGIIMWLQMKMNLELLDLVQKQVFVWMLVIFIFMLGFFLAGFVIYWVWNNLFFVLQQVFIMCKNGVKIELWDNLCKIFNCKVSFVKG